MSSKHRMIKKNFETEMHVNNVELPLNHFIQETMANIVMGFLKTLKEVEESSDEHRHKNQETHEAS